MFRQAFAPASEVAVGLHTHVLFFSRPRKPSSMHKVGTGLGPAGVAPVPYALCCDSWRTQRPRLHCCVSPHPCNPSSVHMAGSGLGPPPTGPKPSPTPSSGPARPSPGPGPLVATSKLVSSSSRYAHVPPGVGSPYVPGPDLLPEGDPDSTQGGGVLEVSASRIRDGMRRYR
jgi:hypothetical protein